MNLPNFWKVHVKHTRFVRYSVFRFSASEKPEEAVLVLLCFMSLQACFKPKEKPHAQFGLES